MDIKQCYEKMGGDYADVRKRLPLEKTVERFIALFLEDKSFETLKGSIAAGDRAAAFSAAHTLKGVSGNVGLTALYEASSALTEALRKPGEGVSESEKSLFEEVEKKYAVTESAIREYFADKN